MNFALILFVLLVITGLVKLLDVLVFRKRRVAQHGQDEQAHRPWWIEYSLSFFPSFCLSLFCVRFCLNRSESRQAPCCRHCRMAT